MRRIIRAAALVALLAIAAAPAAGAQERTASIVLGDPNDERGLVQVEQPDGRTAPVTVEGRSARVTAPGDDPSWGRYIYFRLDDDIAFDGFYVARIEVEYLDEGTASFGLQYDSNDCTATLNGAYDSAGAVQRTGSGTWKTASFELPDARFANRENGGSDFRLSAGTADVGPLTVHRVTLTIVEDRTSTPPTPGPGVPEPVERVSLERSPDRLALDNGYVRAEFDLEHPQIDVIRADFGGRRRYAADLTATGAEALGQSGIVLERSDAVPQPVVDTVGITDPEHRAEGGFDGAGTNYSFAAELLPAPGVVTPPDDGHDDVPLRIADTSGASPNVARASGQTFALPEDGRARYSRLHVFGAGTDGTATGNFRLAFADGSTETRTVTLRDWGDPGADQDEHHVALRTAYRHTSTGNDAVVPFNVYHAVVPVSADAPLVSITFPDFVPNTSPSEFPTAMNIVGLTFEAPDGRVLTPDLAANDGRGDATHASSEGAGPDLAVTVLENGPEKAAVRIEGIVDDPAEPLVTATWTLSLSARERAFRLETSTRALRSSQVASVRVASYLSPASVHGLFERGVVQMLDSPEPDFASESRLERAYVLGAPGGGALDFTISGQRQTVLHSVPAVACGNPPANGTVGSGFRSGVEQVLAGNYPQRDRWTDSGWSAATPTQLEAGRRWRTRATIAANGHNFPTGTLVKPRANLPADDLRAIYTAVYGSAAGVLDTYTLPGAAAPTLASPGRPYGDGRSFFDPDAWETVRALLYSGDHYLQRQAREVIEVTGDAMLASGQIPHHFNGSEPTYVAISGATQTGPNIFWISAALDYAGETGDYRWLRAQMPRIERALDFITDRYDPKVQLISAPGPLWIDVFVRENYTADTSAFMVGLLRRTAAAEAFLGDAQLATRRRALADEIVEGMNARLWRDDHYMTQLNPDGTTRDLVDYDANLLAIAFGVAPPDRAERILERIDAGPCTHGRPTWVSEIYYGPDDTYGGNTGDSATAMARIGWADAHARRAVGDLATYRDRILDPVRADLIERTWLTERYDCTGNPIRVPYYHEYPELVVMLLREITYGIDLGIGTVTIDPFGTSSYRYRTGDLRLNYSAEAVDISVPGTGERAFDVHGLTADAEYVLVTTSSGAAAPQRVRADEHGALRFTAPVGTGTTIRVRRLD